METTTIRFRITGTRPLMLNSPETVNPLSAASKALKELTSKRTKTDEDMMEIFRLKFISCWYRDGYQRYIIPNRMIAASLIDAAKENKLGKKFQQSVVVEEDAILKFEHNGHTPEELFDITNDEGDPIYVDIRAVGVKNVKIPTARAIIPKWSFETAVTFDPNVLNKSEVIIAMENAGLRHGIGTYRQCYGRFSVEVIDEKKKK